MDLQDQNEDLSTKDMMRLADKGGAFDFWNDEGEDIYTIHDGVPFGADQVDSNTDRNGH